MSTDLIRQIAGANDEYAKDFKGGISFDQFPNQKAAIILTCMDPRSNPSEFWKLPFGPAVVRNAGGRATDDALRSMEVLSVVMANGQNTLGVVAVVHHTNCGLTCFSNDYIADRLKRERVGDRPELAAEVDKRDFGAFTDVEGSIREDMAKIKADPLLPKELEVIGFVHDTFTGKTTEVI